MEGLIEFFHLVGKLKATKRAGWLNHDIKNPESVADHSYRTAVLAMIFAKRIGADELKLIKMALLHDVADSVTGDIITERGNNVVYSRGKKLEQQKEAMEKILSNLKQEEHKELLNLWLEFEEGKSKEATIARQLDKLEMALQTFEYEQADHSKNLEEFWIVAEKYIKEDSLKSFLGQLSRREK